MAQNQESAPSKWPELCNDLLYLIYRELDIFDFVRFRAVCKSWYNSIPVSTHPPQLPFLLTDDFTAYSLLTGKTHSLRKPNNQCEMFFGQSQGCLVTYGLLNFSDPHKRTGPPPCLFNPFTTVQQSLPFRDFSLYSPVFLGTDALPDFDDDILIYMTSLAKGNNLTYWLKEEKEWHTVQPLYLAGARTIYKKKLFYYGHHLTTVLDLTTRNTLRSIPNPNSVTDFCCLVESGGSLLGIVKRGDTSFQVYRLEEEEEHKPPHWVQVSDIGDQMIFLNRDDGFSLPASSFNGIRGNCIYFTKWNKMQKPYCMTSILRYDLWRRSSEVVGSSQQRGGTWIVPNLRGKY